MASPGVSPHHRAVGRQRCALSLGALLRGQQLWVLSLSPLDTAGAGGDSRVLAARHCQPVCSLNRPSSTSPGNEQPWEGPVGSSGAGRSWMLLLLLLLCPGHAPGTRQGSECCSWPSSAATTRPPTLHLPHATASNPPRASTSRLSKCCFFSPDSPQIC